MTIAKVAWVWLLALAVAGACLAAEPAPKDTGTRVLLKPRYAPGKYLLSWHSELEEAMVAEGGQKPLRQTSTLMELALDAGQADAAGVTPVEITLRRIVSKSSDGGVSQAFDSDQASEKDGTSTAVILGALMKAMPILKLETILHDVEKKFKSKGEQIVQGNFRAIRRAFEEVQVG
jgi:hypothetical protein